MHRLQFKRFSQFQALKIKPASGSTGTKLETLKWSQMTVKQRVIHTTELTGYTSLIILGIATVSAASYFLTLELLASSRDDTIYNQALDLVKNSPQLSILIGTPMLGPNEVEGWNSHSRWSVKSHFVKDEIVNKRFMRFMVKVCFSVY